MLRPFEKVVRSRNAKTWNFPVPHRVEHEVSPIGCLADAWVFTPSQRIPFLSTVLAREENRFAKPPERRAVGGERKADARSSLAYAFARCVFGTIEDGKFSAERRGRRIERVACFPRDRFAAHGTVKARLGTRRNNYAAFAGKLKPCP